MIKVTCFELGLAHCPSCHDEEIYQGYELLTYDVACCRFEVCCDVAWGIGLAGVR